MKTAYKEKVIPALKKELGLANVMQLPKVEKVVINAGIGGFRESKEAVELFSKELSDIAGQKISVRRARMSEAGFKIRQGQVVGLAVTLRGKKMWAFLDKFINIVLPRVRDFQGLNPRSIDKGGNFSIGIKEHTIFPEVNPNTTKGIRNMQVVIGTSAKTANDAKLLLGLLGFPFEGEKVKKNG